MSRLKRLIHEIHRRSLWQVLGIYLGGAWVALQGIEALVSVLGLPVWVPGVALVLLIVGLPIVLATAFVQEGVGAGEVAAEAPVEAGAATPADEGGLHLVLTWRNVVLGGVAVVALAGVGVAGWLLLGGEISGSPGAIRSIAVLPLENLTGDPEQEYFADGMTEAVISEFARLGALSVISRTSVMRYKQSDKSLPEIAQELGVQGVVEGSVFRAGERVRITLQLIDARNDLHLWAQTYERDLSDVLGLQGDVARAVAEQIRLKLTPEEQAALTPSRTVDPEAYDVYLRGLQIRGPSTLVATWGPQAIDHFEQAVEADADFAEAWAAVAWVRAELGISTSSLRYLSEFAKAREAAKRALEIEDRLGLAHAVVGNVQLWHDWDFPGARRTYERALQLSPSDPVVLENYAWYLLTVEKRNEEVLDLSEQLLRVAPFDLFFRAARVKFFHVTRHFERALAEIERLRGLEPDYVDFNVSQIYFALGRTEEAFREELAYQEKCGVPCQWEVEALRRGWADGGWEGSWRAWLEKATEVEACSPWLIALRYAMVGEVDEAFAWLERGYRERDPSMILLRVAKALDPLRSDPRMDDLLRRIGFPEE